MSLKRVSESRQHPIKNATLSCLCILSSNVFNIPPKQSFLRFYSILVGCYVGQDRRDRAKQIAQYLLSTLVAAPIGATARFLLHGQVVASSHHLSLLSHVFIFFSPFLRIRSTAFISLVRPILWCSRNAKYRLVALFFFFSFFFSWSVQSLSPAPRLGRHDFCVTERP